MSMQDRFDDAVKRSRQLPNQSNENLLEIYALFKQATKGDASGSRPGMFDMKGRAKFDAWAKKKGMSEGDAMEAYIALIDRLGN